jgi:heme/copper-type cytochrome/quinol oxidase subunit 2
MTVPRAAPRRRLTMQWADERTEWWQVVAIVVLAGSIMLGVAACLTVCFSL